MEKLHKKELKIPIRKDTFLPSLMKQAGLDLNNFYVITTQKLFFPDELDEILKPRKILENKINKELNIYPVEGIFEFKFFPKYLYITYSYNSFYGSTIYTYFLLLPALFSDHSVFLNYLTKTIADLEQKTRKYNKLSKNYINRLFLEGNKKESILNKVQLFLNNKKFYDEHKLPWKMGILLYGPPGNGKTLLIKAISEYFNLYCEDLMDYIDNGRLELDKVKEPENSNFLDRISCYKKYYKEDSKPIIYFLEDIDKQVFGSGSDIPKLPVNELLQTLDGVDEISDTIIIATTNYVKDLIDAIVSRPGRFDVVYSINNPNSKQIEQLLKYYDFNIIDIPRNELIRSFEGQSMAFIENFIKSCILMYKKTKFEKKEIESIRREINEHLKITKKFGLHEVGFSR